MISGSFWGFRSCFKFEFCSEDYGCTPPRRSFYLKGVPFCNTSPEISHFFGGVMSLFSLVEIFEEDITFGGTILVF